MAITPKPEYHTQLTTFVNLVTEHQKKANPTSDIVAYFETGRKFDKIILKHGAQTTVRYFVDRRNGNIYGAKSAFAPNLRWYFGNIERSTKWTWGGFHGSPVNDDSVRAIKNYGPYQHYMQI